MREVDGCVSNRNDAVGGVGQVIIENDVDRCFICDQRDGWWLQCGWPFDEDQHPIDLVGTVDNDIDDNFVCCF